MLVFQRHMALQRFQEQEQQIQQRRIFQQQQLSHGNNIGQIPIPGMVGPMNYYPNSQQQIEPNEMYQAQSVANNNVQQPSLSYIPNTYTSPGLNFF